MAAAWIAAAVGAAASVWRPLAPRPSTAAVDVARFDPDLLTTVATYVGPRRTVALVAVALSVAVPVALAVTERGRRALAPLVGDRSGAASRWPTWRAGLAVVAVAAVTSLVTAPIGAWVALVHDRRWGFRTGGVDVWLRDWILVNGGRWVGLGLATVVVLAVARRWPTTWPHRVTVLATLAAIGLVLVHPILLQPLLLTTTPLPDGDLRDRIAAVAAEAGADGVPIVEADASRRTTRANALVTGLGPTERVVLYDTLVATLDEDEIVAVVAHELAHRQNRDLLRGALLTATAALPLGLLLRRVLDDPRVRRRSGATVTADPRHAVAALAVVVLAELVGSPVASAVSRRAEAAADHTALALGAEPDTLVRTVRTFVVRDLSDPTPPPWVHLVWGTHPTPRQRLTAAAEAAERSGADLPTLADLAQHEATIRHPRAGPG